MPSKTSKTSRPQPLPWKVEPVCSETQALKIARDLASELKPGDRVLLEGQMGAGKTTFARALLAGLGVHQPPEGSPTFAIVHEYESPVGAVAHMDLYRLKSEDELEDAGLSTYFWERRMIVITEWLSMFPGYEQAVLGSGCIWRVTIELGADEGVRSLVISRV